MKAFQETESASSRGAHYEDHRVISIHKIWEARAAGLPDPEWVPVAKPKQPKRRPLTEDAIRYILTSDDTPEVKAARLGVTKAGVLHHLENAGLLVRPKRKFKNPR